MRDSVTDWILLDILSYTHCKHWVKLSLVSKRWQILIHQLIEKERKRKLFSPYLLGLHVYKPKPGDIIRQMRRACQESYLRNLLRRGRSPHTLLSKALRRDCKAENILILIDESLRLKPEGDILTAFTPREGNSACDTARSFARAMIRGGYSPADIWSIIFRNHRFIDVIELLHWISSKECAWDEFKVVHLLSILEPLHRDIALMYAVTNFSGRPKNIGKYVRNLKYKSCRDLVEDKLGKKYSRWRLSYISYS